MQTISSSCEYNIKYAAFLKAANGYDDLITTVRFEIDFSVKHIVGLFFMLSLFLCFLWHFVLIK